MRTIISQKRLVLTLGLFTALILGLWFGYHIFITRSFSQSATENVELAASRLLEQVSAEISQMNAIAGAIAGSSTVQEFLKVETIHDFFTRAERASAVIRDTLHLQAFVDNVITFDTDGNFFRFAGGLSNAACESLFYRVRGGALHNIVELDGVLFFGLSAAVYSLEDYITVRVGTVVLLTHLDRTRVALAGYAPLSIDTAVIQDDIILLSTNPVLEGIPDIGLYHMYGLVSRMYIAGTGLSVAAAVPEYAIFPARPLFYATSFALLVIMLVSVVFLFTTLTSRQKLYKAELLRQDMRIGLLTSQINAHFVVNTIANIHTLTTSGDNENAGRMADGLMQLIKHRHGGDELCNLFLEFEMLGRYVEVMNIRHNGKFTVEYEVDDELAAYLIPGLILQPIVENALTHGLQLKDGEAVIKIYGYKKDDAIHIEISDNGAGIAPEKFAELRAALEAADFGNFPDPGLSGVALCNVHRRIRLRFGNEYGLSIDSAQGSGTTATILIPAIPE